MPASENHYDVAVIGAGQAGLAVSYYLTSAKVNHIVLEAGARVGSSWSNRWESLKLFTPARYSSLPGLSFPAAPDSYPNKSAVASYLQRYVEQFRLPVRTSAAVSSLTRDGNLFELTTPHGRLTANRVVVASGAFGQPYSPELAEEIAADVVSLHSHTYRQADQVPDGVVVIVGAGNTGYQIALELASAGRTVHLAEGHRARSVPQRVAGRDIFWFLTRTGAISAPSSSFIGKRMQANEPIVGTSRRTLQQLGVRFQTRAVQAAGNRIQFEDGAEVEADTVIWATGYRHNDRWIRIEGALDQHGVLRRSRSARDWAAMATKSRVRPSRIHRTRSARTGRVTQSTLS